MKKIIRKTKKEIKETFEEIKLGDYIDHFCLTCDKCGVAFFKDDIALKSSSRCIKCPLMVKRKFTKTRCENKMYGGSEEYFNKYYKII